MGKGKDFFGKDIADVIEQACVDFQVSQEDLRIEVLETGSAGIFGLCKKKAHIRVQRKKVPLAASVEEQTTEAETAAAAETVTTPEAEKVPAKLRGGASGKSKSQRPKKEKAAVAEKSVAESTPQEEETEVEAQTCASEEPVPVPEVEVPVEPPTEEGLQTIRADLDKLLSFMGLASQVEVRFDDNTVLCQINGEFEEQIIGPDGRTLDSLQYLLRKMVARHLPDRIMLVVNVGDFRERRAEELKKHALELAEQVKADGKTQSIPALNPSERRVVHMALQEDKGVRSRSVGDGLFKKVLIYKPGKGRRPAAKKRRGGQGGNATGD